MVGANSCWRQRLARRCVGSPSGDGSYRIKIKVAEGLFKKRLMMNKPPETTRKSGVYMAPRHSQDKKGIEGGWMPLVSGRPLKQTVATYPVSGFVSAIPNCTIPRWWGGLPSRKWGKTGIRTSRHIRALRPVEMGTFAFLTHLVSFWAQPVSGMAALADDFRERGAVESDPEVALNYDLLELKMRYELGEISEQDYKKEETKLKKRLEDIQKVKKGPIEEKPVKKKEKPKPEKKKKPKKKGKKKK
ncbi:MAG: Gas vesicle protein G [Candidatus Scalindua rubra]|uniref:Gas vesicle protein G n=1 Tax=Candidatus Scalindua rubra TaxID=1872076 RepID=A0A1E3XF61_9BACT|nr:MAG: Gas vesicle protein G [Candidatus Scalindua rubra]